MEEKKNKKSKIIKGMALLGLFLLVFGVSYALFSVVLNGTKRNRITTGNLGLILTDTSGTEEKDLPEGMMGINLEEALPMTQEEGLKTEPYKFVVKNTGKIPVSYTLKLNDIEEVENTLKDEYIRYNLITQDYLKEYREGNFAQGYFSTEKAWIENSDSYELQVEASPKLSDLTNRVLDRTTLLPGESMEYTLNLWLDYEATTEQAANKTFEGKIEIKGEQAIVHTTGKAGDNIDYTLYNDGTLILTGTGAMSGIITNEEEELVGISNNISPIIDIVYQHLAKNGIQLSEITADNLTGYIHLNYYYLGFNTAVDDNLIKEFVKYDDVDGIKKLIDELPKINRIAVGEGITETSIYFIYYFDKMITLPATLQKIPFDSMLFSLYLNIPNSVTYIGIEGIPGTAVINIDNSKEFTENNFDEYWYQVEGLNYTTTINYLR